MGNPRSQRRFLVFLLLLAAAPLTLWLQIRWGLKPSPEAFRDLVSSWGIGGPLAFIGMLAIRPLILFPSAVLFIAGGLAFGVALGTAYAAVGATIGACVGFSLARALGKEYVESKLRGRFSSITYGSSGPRLVLLLNLIPIFPISAINYGAGLSGIPLRRFVAATILGVTPRAFAYCFFGSSLIATGSWRLAAALALLVALTLLPTLWRRRLVSSSKPVNDRPPAEAFG